VVNSTDFVGGYFRLLLTSPVEEGNYTCRVHQDQHSAACIHGNANNLQGSVMVDKVS
jgi:hypothetical protein